MGFRFFLAVLSLLFLQACNADGLFSIIYPDRERYEVFSEVSEETLVYLCSPGETEADTNARVMKAHQMFEAYIEQEAGKLVDAILEQEEFSYWQALKAAWKMNSAADDMVDRMDSELECLPIEN